MEIWTTDTKGIPAKVLKNDIECVLRKGKKVYNAYEIDFYRTFGYATNRPQKEILCSKSKRGVNSHTQQRDSKKWCQKPLVNNYIFLEQ